MTALGKMTEEQALAIPVNAKLLHIGTEALAAFADRRNELVDALDELTDLGDETSAKLAERLATQLDTLEPSITMIGQVKAGKTSLVNALVGMPDLLPADVNPWTSVVTSLHLAPAGFGEATRARFSFFSEEEWSRLVNRGGRIGELASRAGADEELEKVRAQLNEMREKSKRRLGKKFEMLLGQSHDYSAFDRDLIQRYVCLGDDFDSETDTTRTQGRFADITRSADLYIDRPDLPMGLCIRDTPGVNDTFMMREQITIRAIRESRLCVVVLSAHQALSAVDLALIRLISNVKSREVVIFVNRIDELSEPKTQVPEIRDSIRATLRAHQGPEDAEIVFGSAYWANKALTGELGSMAEASSASLLDWAEAAVIEMPRGRPPEELIWRLSGVPNLMRALSQRIVEGDGAEALDRTARSAQNLVQAMRAAGAGPGAGLAVQALLPRAELEVRLAKVERDAQELLQDRFKGVAVDFERRLDRAHRGFLERATAALIQHLETYGDEHVWKYDPSGLRLLLRSAFQVFAAGTARKVQSVYDETATALAQLYVDGFGLPAERVRVEPPVVPRVAPPVQIGQTIALDLKTNWWRRWWQRRRGYQAYAAEFSQMIEAETGPILHDLKTGIAAEVGADSHAILREFLATQRKLLIGLAEQAESGRLPAGAADADARRADLHRLGAAFAAFAA